MRGHCLKTRFDLYLRESRSRRPNFRSGSEGHLGGSYGSYKLQIPLLTKKRAMIFKIVDADGRRTHRQCKVSPFGDYVNRWDKKLILHFDYVTLHNWLYHQNKNFFWKLSMYLNRKCLHKGDGLNSFRTVFISKIFLVNPHCPLKPFSALACALHVLAVPHQSRNTKNAPERKVHLHERH